MAALPFHHTEWRNLSSAHHSKITSPSLCFHPLSCSEAPANEQPTQKEDIVDDEQQEEEEEDDDDDDDDDDYHYVYEDEEDDRESMEKKEKSDDDVEEEDDDEVEENIQIKTLENVKGKDSGFILQNILNNDMSQEQAPD